MMGSAFDSFDGSPLGARIQSAVDGSGAFGVGAAGDLWLRGLIVKLAGTTIGSPNSARFDATTDTAADDGTLGAPYVGRRFMEFGGSLYTCATSTSFNPAVQIRTGAGFSNYDDFTGSGSIWPENNCHELHVLSGKLIAVGRLWWPSSTYDGTSVMQYDPATDEWTRVGSSGWPYQPHGSAVIGSTLYVIGYTDSSLNTYGLFTWNGTSWSNDATLYDNSNPGTPIPRWMFDVSETPNDHNTYRLTADGSTLLVAGRRRIEGDFPYDDDIGDVLTYDGASYAQHPYGSIRDPSTLFYGGPIAVNGATLYAALTSGTTNIGTRIKRATASGITEIYTGNATNSTVTSMIMHAGKLYAAGNNLANWGITSPGIARRNDADSAWEALGDGDHSVSVSGLYSATNQYP